MSEPNTFSDQIAAHLKEAWTADRQADWARGNGTYRGGCEPGALWPNPIPTPWAEAKREVPRAVLIGLIAVVMFMLGRWSV